jgi:hypothetical protein
MIVNIVRGMPVLKLGFSHASPADIEREADRIVDPVERLRYLRKHSASAVQETFPRTQWSKSSRAGIGAVALVLAMGVGYAMLPSAQAPPAAKAVAIPSARPAPKQVWQVEGSEIEEVYSNGLRIDLSFATRLRPRAEYPIYALTGDSQPVATDHVPRGIVYHTTESDMVVFEQTENKKIARLGHLLLRYVRQEHSYHYLIDRFGRVYRVVEESDAAYHAGFSVWGDDRGVYVNLNDSFIGIAFEGTTSKPDDVTGAQLSAAKALTELLISRYNIRPEDCVTHAQVSVNPSNMVLANHKDWARAFPFAAMNLPDNYRLPIWAVEAFGFAHDEDLLAASGGKDWPGLISADKKLVETAASQGATEIRYRGMLRHRYQEILADVRQRSTEAQKTKSN